LLLTGRGITLGSISAGSRADFEAMNRAIAMHCLHPVIYRTFPFTEAKAAYRYFEDRGHSARSYYAGLMGSHMGVFLVNSIYRRH
jgi:NADPH:quinone reductase-like Zn-dependent oxidoreductase